MVSRSGMTTATEALLAARRVFYPLLAVFVDWPGDPSHTHSGSGFLRVDGYVFRGVGPAGRIRVPPEQEGLVPAVAELELVGVPDHLLEVVSRQDARGSRVRIWVAFATSRAGNELVPGTGLIDLFTGYVVKQRLRMEVVDESTIQQSLIVSVGSGPRGRSAASVTHSDEDQRSQYPGDTAGRHLIYGQKNARREFWVP